MSALPPVFVDSAALLALVHRRDQSHARAMRVEADLRESGRRLFTSDWVLTEFLAGAARQPLRGSAVSVVRRLRRLRQVSIVPATRDDWNRAFELYANRADKEWSLVDCASILICRDRGITEVFSHDHHFEQAGLRVLL